MQSINHPGGKQQCPLSLFFLQSTDKMMRAAHTRRALFSTSSILDTRVVCVGGVAGGATAAARLRRLDEKAEITILERGKDVSFANCGLPYYIGEDIKQRDKLLLHTPQSLGQALNISVKTGQEVTSIDRASKKVRVQPVDGSPAYELPYDKLILSPGASPIRPPIPGISGLPNVFVLRTMQDTDAIKAQVDALAKKGGHAVVLGAGFIGLELVENLHRRGLRVTLVEARDQILPQLDQEMTTAMTNDIRSSGVQVLLGARATEIKEKSPGSSALVVHLSSGVCFDAEMVLVSTGVRPESSLAAAAGLALDPASKAIVVDEHMRTSDPAVYACGDAVAAPSLLDPSARVWVPMGGPANRQARLAAEHIVLQDKADAYRGTLGTAIVRCFSSSSGVTGLTEAALKRLGKPYESVLVHGVSHASYYPGAESLGVKVLFDPVSRRVLGGQVAGGSEGVDKRLDVLATLIASKGTVDDLAHLELSYAPPFGSARDVLNTAGFAALNAKQGLLKPAPLGTLTNGTLDPATVVLDVRDSTSSLLRPIAKLMAENGASGGNEVVNVPASDLRASLAKLDATKFYLTVCNQGKLSYFSSRILQQAGFEHVRSLPGGMTTAAPPIANNEVTNTSEAKADNGRPQNQKAAKIVDVDACGLACPGPIMALRKAITAAEPGTLLVVKASDPGFASDVKAFARTQNIEVVSVTRDKGVITAQLAMPGEGKQSAAAAASATATVSGPASNDVTIVLFSGEMDKVLAALVIANGAVAMGGRATIFTTFWGLSALKNDGSLPAVNPAAPAAEVGSFSPPSILQKMMGMMLPSGSGSLPLSNMNFGGLGPVMMQKVMKDRHLPSVQSLFKEAVESKKIRFVACSMSMDALGVAPSELLPGVEIGGVAEMLASSSTSKSTLFI